MKHLENRVENAGETDDLTERIEKGKLEKLLRTAVKTVNGVGLLFENSIVCFVFC
ncbi:hypothetical protein FHU41_002547 [Psychromicrobium silvestre]|uniref:Uncharacterized protein n=1 Tax=Psychromicrobium silvestre TaxID=1645614 RepID=A0A7Y9LVC5_9MICC|nr:hypothetical protein [Psychromicrobium silvestre]